MTAERGQILPMFATLIMVLLGFLAIAIDLGQGYLERRANQNGADAAAVAGEQALIHGATDANIESAIRNTLLAGGYGGMTVAFATSPSGTSGSDTHKVYVDAEYGAYGSGSTCTPFTSGQYVGNGTIPTGTSCIKVVVSTTRNTLFANVPVIGAAQIGASAGARAGQVSTSGFGNQPIPTATPTPGPWNTGDDEGWAIWGGKTADGHVNTVGSAALFFADSGWNYGNDVLTNCNPCEYQATQNFKGLADPQCFTNPPPNTCTGPNGAHGNAAAGLTPGTSVQVVVVTSVQHTGSDNQLTPIGLVTLKVLASCPSSPTYFESATDGVCGTIEHIDYGTLSETVTPTPTATLVVGNTN